MMGSAREVFRVEYRRTESVAAAEASFAAAVKNGEFDGAYYRLEPEVRELPDGRIRLKAPSVSERLEVGTITFDLKTGESVIEWHNTDPDR